MYGSYSLLIVSLIPTFITMGDFQNTVQLYQNRLMSYDDAIKVLNRTNVCSAISIGCGVLFVFELIRYFYAANSVLPQKSKIVPESKQIMFDQPFENPSPKKSENHKNNITEELNQDEEQSENQISADNKNSGNDEKKIDENNNTDENKN